MCGIAGYIDAKNETSHGTLDSMTDALVHRGPDGRGIWKTVKDEIAIGLGHRRLAIIELSELGSQPMHCGSSTIVFNGEIYNFQEIRKELVELNHSFISHSDTEVILHAYQEWGIDCAKRFIGMFAFVIFNNDTGKVLIMRDRAGVKPLFWYFKDGLFLFSSELKSFHQHEKFDKSISLPAIESFLRFGYVPSSHCIFQYAHKLEPGRYFEFTIDELKSDQFVPTIHEYWSVSEVYNQSIIEASDEELIQLTKEKIVTACNYRMVSDVPVGVFLSGGYDSTAVTSILQQESRQRLKTFTIGVPDLGLDEAPFAKQIAAHLGTDHTTYYCSESDAMRFVEKIPYFFDEPFADSSAIPTMMVSEQARKEVTVALSADGGDELFGGYNRYGLINKYGERLEKLPAVSRKMMHQLMRVISPSKVPFVSKSPLFHQRYEKIKNVLKDSSPEFLLSNLSQFFSERELSDLLVQRFPKLTTRFDASNLIEPSRLKAVQAMDFQTYLPDDILQKVDRASMHIGLESREPLLDHHLVEWAAQLPDHVKIRNGEKKWILKQIVHQHVPKELLDRPKMGFAVPIENWLMGPLKHYIDKYLNESYINNQGLFQFDYLDRLTKQFLAGKKELGVRVWYLISFQIWYAEWIDKK